jgi:hypothetical protein
MGTLLVMTTTIRTCGLRFHASPFQDNAPSRHSVGLALMQLYSLRSPAHHRPDVSLSWALPQAFASSGILLPCRIRLAPTLCTEGRWGVTPFPLSIVRTLRATLSTGFRDGAHGSVRWLPASYPVPFGSSVSPEFDSA